MKDDFLRPVTNIAHPTHPFHLIGRFQGFGHSLLSRHGRDKSIHTFMASGISFSKMFPQLSSENQACICTGVILVYKRLENGSFQWPRNGEEARQLTPQQYRWLMEGLSIEQLKAHKPMSGLRIV